MTTPRTLLFDSPFLLGFDHTRALIDRAAKAAAESYPPYNVEQIGDAGVRISLAVAGFSPDQLEVEVQDRQLTVAGRKGDGDGADRAFLHRGIAKRAFERRFQLADVIKVTGASFENGLLNIDLKREVPEHKKPRKVEIGANDTPMIDGEAA